MANKTSAEEMKKNNNHNSSNTNSKHNDRNDSARQSGTTTDEDRKHATAPKDGRTQSKENNPGNFANNPERAKEAGRKGGSS